ncbi:cob(I)yrinic acid a,c-diamide adenosyltransferase [Barnesiella propionica]|uniref:cob(I)yrinic acid a,c-diamide adenosyltransferase n=1 Tax=Barnesiella propionica TaxID=2981781 RepID=UPI0011C9B452|nr:cob(I)yrinic acid a,c-diamide adenosyltransferase [Barnesiella propionica]MCU6769051.1 cob(I)yrinic acid a,c-diamide adenosyltransferase [Barnesiella propionica]
MKKSNVYTFTGDKGTTSLVGGKRVPKTDVRLEAYGTVDELNTQIGFLLSLPDIDNMNRKLLHFAQNKLFVIGSYLATDISFTELREASKMKDEDIKRIEQRIDEMDEVLPPLNAFILPGGTPAASAAHICRTVCRRAERRICDVAATHKVDENILRFVNRLSDYFFVLARFNNIENKQDEFFWNKSC